MDAFLHCGQENSTPLFIVTRVSLFTVKTFLHLLLKAYNRPEALKSHQIVVRRVKTRTISFHASAFLLTSVRTCSPKGKSTFDLLTQMKSQSSL